MTKEFIVCEYKGETFKDWSSSFATSVRRINSNNTPTNPHLSSEPHYRLSSTYAIRTYNPLEQLYPFSADSSHCRAGHELEDIQDHRSGSGEESCIESERKWESGLCIWCLDIVQWYRYLLSISWDSYIYVTIFSNKRPVMPVIASPPTTCETIPVPLSSGFDHSPSPFTLFGELDLKFRGPSLLPIVFVLMTRHGAGAWRSGSFALEGCTSTLATPPKKSVTSVSWGEILDNSVDTPGWDLMSPGS